MNELKKNLYELRKNDPELEDVLQVVDQIRRVYADIKEVQGSVDKPGVPVTSNSATVNIMFRSNSSSH